MSKKNFKTGFDALLGEKENASKERSISSNREAKKVSTTVMTDIITIEKIRFIAYWQRKNIKDVMSVAFNEYINRYESTHGEIKIPHGSN
jgi:hypothetical protein